MKFIQVGQGGQGVQGGVNKGGRGGAPILMFVDLLLSRWSVVAILRCAEVETFILSERKRSWAGKLNTI